MNLYLIKCTSFLINVLELSRTIPNRNMYVSLFIVCDAGFGCRVSILARVSVQGVESLWGDCRFIPADWGSQYEVDLCYFALFEDFSL